jgi:hypothetical protein
VIGCFNALAPSIDNMNDVALTFACPLIAKHFRPQLHGQRWPPAMRPSPFRLVSAGLCTEIKRGGCRYGARWVSEWRRALSTELLRNSVDRYASARRNDPFWLIASWQGRTAANLNQVARQARETVLRAF